MVRKVALQLEIDARGMTKGAAEAEQATKKVGTAAQATAKILEDADKKISGIMGDFEESQK